MEQQERDAIGRLKRGDISGLEMLVRRYQDPALKAAFLIGRDHALAEDIVQAAFLRAFERIEQFDVDRPFGPWFLRSVVNDALMAATRRRHERLDGECAADFARVASLDPAPDALLVAAETKEAIWAVLEQLTPGQRAAVVARYYLGLPNAEAAQRLNCPPGTLRRRLHDARGRLRQLLPAWIRQPTGDRPDSTT